jgi:hypothetical protein
MNYQNRSNSNKKKQMQTSMIKNEELLDEAVALMNRGYSNQYIIASIAESRQISYRRVKEIVKEAVSFIVNQHSTNIETVRSIHLMRYDRLINDLMAVEELDPSEIGKTITQEEWAASREKKKAACLNAITAIQQKERVLQLHNDGFELEVNTDEQVEVVEKKEEYDVTKLTFDEQKELLEIMQKARTDNNPIASVVESSKEIIQVAEVVHGTDALANIDQIKHETLPVTLTDVVPVADPLSKLKDRMRMIAAKEMQRIGANLDDDEKLLIDSGNDKQTQG